MPTAGIKESPSLSATTATTEPPPIQREKRCANWRHYVVTVLIGAVAGPGGYGLWAHQSSAAGIGAIALGATFAFVNHQFHKMRQFERVVESDQNIAQRIHDIKATVKAEDQVILAVKEEEQKLQVDVQNLHASDVSIHQGIQRLEQDAQGLVVLEQILEVEEQEEKKTLAELKTENQRLQTLVKQYEDDLSREKVQTQTLKETVAQLHRETEQAGKNAQALDKVLVKMDAQVEKDVARMGKEIQQTSQLEQDILQALTHHEHELIAKKEEISQLNAESAATTRAVELEKQTLEALRLEVTTATARLKELEEDRQRSDKERQEEIASLVALREEIRAANAALDARQVLNNEFNAMTGQLDSLLNAMNES
jgi:hypothetical protein